MTIRVLSFDFDGCLFHGGYINSENKNVIKSNEAFLEAIKQENQEFANVYTFVGSNRQSYNIDRLNSYGKGSCFPAVQEVSKHLDTTLDTFLLADIFGDLPAGTSYQRATATGSQKHEVSHSDWRFDETKVTLIYAQIHKVANENPNEPIIVDFYDDRGNRARAYHDILEHLRDFYTTHADLIPENVTLRLNHYAGGQVTLMNEIKGTGFIDENYRQTVKDLSEQAIIEAWNDGYNGPIHVAVNANPQELKNRKARSASLSAEQPQLHLEQESTLLGALLEQDNSHHAEQPQLHLEQESTLLKALPKQDNSHPVSEKELLARKKFGAALQAILAKADELDQAGEALYNEHLSQWEQSQAYASYKGAAEAARDLHQALTTASEAYFQNYDKKAFKDIAAQAIQEASDSELKNHRGYAKQILSYAGLAVLAILSVVTAGVAYAVAGSINYALNRQFFFSTKVNTDSINKVNELNASVEELIDSTLTI